MGKFILTIKDRISCARALRDYAGQCANIHGHNFLIEIFIDTSENEQGFDVDFYEIKAELVSVSEDLDHKYLNELKAFESVNPTTENIARYYYDKMSSFPRKKNICISHVTVSENEDFSATYYPDGLM